MIILKTLKTLSLAVVLTLASSPCHAGVFDLLDLSRPGLEKVADYHKAGNDSLASVALLDYFKTRHGIKGIGVNPENPKITEKEQKWADEGLEHKFYVHDGYQPSYFYGDDIDWTYWPVKDNELRWQLHRTKWWVPMGKAYRTSGDEKYAAEWVKQYRDWIKKNPLTRFDGTKDKDMEQVDNVYFAWRPLEVADRLERQIDQFELFLPSENFTPDFLIEFLDNYHRHAQFVNSHYSKQGNHLLFEAQRILFAGVFFPEFKEAATWRKAGIDILNAELAKQILPDGVHFELDPRYHFATIGIYGKALRMTDKNGYTDEFPESYRENMAKMMNFAYNITYPDYTVPMFSDNKLYKKPEVISQFRSWSALIPEDANLSYFATEGANGEIPSYTSKDFPVGGFYVLRNGWDPASTVMIVKAGPKGEWHNQPDNGTFELWSKGRNFFPDSGSYIYGGDDEVLEQRNWFRQTKVHNTLTLDNRNLENNETELVKWETSPEADILIVETPGYEGLTHRRTIHYDRKNTFTITDEAFGEATGEVTLHFQLLPCDVTVDETNMTLGTSFDDGNNISLQVEGADRMLTEEGWTSPDYRVKQERPAFAFTKTKNGADPVVFRTIINTRN